jgi:hypothetical protein
MKNLKQQKNKKYDPFLHYEGDTEVEELYEDDEEEQMLRKLFTRSLRNH